MDTVAGIDVDKRLFPVEQAELGAKLAVGHRGVGDLLEGRQQGADAGAHVGVLLRRQEARPQHGAQRPIAEEQATRPQLRVQLFLRVVGHGVRQQVVVGDDRFG